MREEIEKQVLDSASKNILLELATGVGKTKIALIKTHQLWTNCDNKCTILIVVPRLVLIQTWKEEILKWGFGDMVSDISFVTYSSFIKGKSVGDIVIFDECHHLSERCFDVIHESSYKHTLLLSASLNRNKYREIQNVFKPQKFQVSERKAIDNGILPDPKVYLIRLMLDNTRKTEVIVKNASKRSVVRIPFAERFNTKKYSNNRIEIVCTQREYYSNLEALTSYYERNKFVPYGLTKYLRAAGERTKYLSGIKEPLILEILNKLKGKRTLTFCKDIAQTEKLGKNAINSKSKKSAKVLEDFNNKKVNHITSCNILDEGVNLIDCQIGVYAYLNSSEKMIVQKCGRILRHKNPIFIIPYYANSREEELMHKMCENYNKDRIIRLSYEEFINLKEI